MPAMTFLTRLPARLGVLGIALDAAAAIAGPNENAKILIHLRPRFADFLCVSSVAACPYIDTSGELYPPTYFAVFLVTDADPNAGIAGADFGVSYDSGYFISWFLCGDSEFPTSGPHGDWPAPGSSNRIVWDSSTNCQRVDIVNGGGQAIGGWFYLAAYSSGDLAVTPSVGTGLATVTSCNAVVDTVQGGVVRTPSHLGFARFSESGTEAGYNPCGLNTPTEPTTWGRIKAQYRG